MLRRMPAEDVQARLAEVDAHLRDGIEGRLELGLDPESAERETIVAFGRVSELARLLIGEGLSRFRVARLRWLAAYFSTVFIYVSAVAYVSESAHPLTVLGLFAAGILTCLTGGAVASFRARRAAPIQIMASGLAASFLIWAAMGGFMLNLWAYGGMGYVGRFSANRLLGLERSRLAETNKGAATIRTSDESSVEAIVKAQADPIGNLVSQAGTAFSMGMGFASFAGVIDLTFGGLGALAIRRRRKLLV